MKVSCVVFACGSMYYCIAYYMEMLNTPSLNEGDVLSYSIAFLV